MKLAAKLILIFLAGVLGIVSLFAWQTIRRQHVWEHQRREAHATDLVSALRPGIVNAYRQGGTVTIQQAVEISTRQLHGAQVRWVDGREVPLPQTQITSRKISSISISDNDGTRTAYSYVPLVIDGDQSGVVEVAQPMDEQDAHVRDSLFASIISLLGVAALSAVVIYRGGVQLVGKPLGKLIEQVNAIGEGNLAQPPALSSHDELGRLAAAISQMSHRLSQQRDAIRHTDRLGTVGTLAAGMAHELGTPLNVVSGRAGLIAGGQLSAEEIQSSARTIKTEADRMTAIIRQLLDFARQVPSLHEPVDLNEIVSRTGDLMRSLAKKSAVDLQLNLCDTPLRIEGDAAQVQQVLTNLISNAIQAMPRGGVVAVSSNRRDGHNCIEVSDTGIGIAPENLAHVFEPFYTTKDVGQGTGLGLSIAYGIVREHGGEIKVESQEGSGTTFTVCFPAAQAVDRTGKDSSQ